MKEAKLEIERIRGALWELHERLEADEIDAEEADARTGVLDSLTELVGLELHAEHRSWEGQPGRSAPVRNWDGG